MKKLQLSEKVKRNLILGLVSLEIIATIVFIIGSFTFFDMGKAWGLWGEDSTFQFEKWKWDALQAFQLVSLIFAVIAPQCKKRKWVLAFRCFAMATAMIGFCFVFTPGGVTVCAVALIAPFVGIVSDFIKNKKTKKIVVWTSMMTLIVVQGLLNLLPGIVSMAPFTYYWTNWISWIYGILCVTTAMQPTANRVRISFSVQATLGVVYYLIQMPVTAPINSVSQIFNLVSAIVAILVIDLGLKKKKENKTEEFAKPELEIKQSTKIETTKK
jgi:hypothetical protein